LNVGREHGRAEPGLPDGCDIVAGADAQFRGIELASDPDGNIRHIAAGGVAVIHQHDRQDRLGAIS